MGALDGKIAIVSGGSRGIGRAIAERLADDGARVIVDYARGSDAARDIVTTIERAGGRAIAVQADASNLDDVRRLFVAAERLGGADIVVANAGIVLGRPLREPLDEDYEQVLAINARGTFYLLREAARRIRDGGRIVTISTAATILSLTRVLARDLGARSVTANIVSPALCPAGRFGTPAAIADVVGFLVTAAARSITAQNIQATGGVT